MKNTELDYENSIIKEFRNNSEPVCYYCNKAIQTNSNRNDLTVDHKMPLSRGGKSIYSNLVISCLSCNAEKADMAEREYKKFKVLQKRLTNSLDAIKLSKKALDLFDKIIDQAQKVNLDYNKAQKEILNLEKDIASRNYSATNSLQTLCALKNAINLRDNLKKQRDAISILHSMIVPMKKQIENAKIVDMVLKENYSEIKAQCMGNSSHKVICIANSLQERK
jgi:Restriction endonuclease